MPSNIQNDLVNHIENALQTNVSDADALYNLIKLPSKPVPIGQESVSPHRYFLQARAVLLAGQGNPQSPLERFKLGLPWNDLVKQEKKAEEAKVSELKKNIPGASVNFSEDRATFENYLIQNKQLLRGPTMLQSAQRYLNARPISVWLINHGLGAIVKWISPLRFKKIELTKSLQNSLNFQHLAPQYIQNTLDKFEHEISTAVQSLKRIGKSADSKTGQDSNSEFEKAFPRLR